MEFRLRAIYASYLSQPAGAVTCRPVNSNHGTTSREGESIPDPCPFLTRSQPLPRD